MKYVLLGTLGADWAAKHAERTAAAKSKLGELDITLESVQYIQGPYDFVDLVDAPSADAILAFSVWYASQGYGRIVSCPAFDDAAMAAALGK